MRQDFYVYQHARKDTGAIFYVGKGRGKRANTSTKRAAQWTDVVQNAGGRTVSYLVTNVDEELAFLCEIEAIDKYRRLGAKLVNKTIGGEGSSGYKFVMSESHKNKIAAAKIGVSRPKEAVEKMRLSKMGRLTGKDNPFFGKKHTAETKEILRTKSGSRTHTEEAKAKIKASLLSTYKTHVKCKPVHCITNGKIYCSINAAARDTGLNRSCISLVCSGKLGHTAGYKFEWSEK